jgi:aryl-phospho-beta-D-glucosidase BglC (GH1 family)
MFRFPEWLRAAARDSRSAAPVQRARLALTALEAREVPAVVGYELVNSWSGGQQATISVSNDTGPAVTQWTVQFNFSGTISQVWNAELVSRSGNTYTFKNVSHNGNLPLNAATSFGFVSTNAPAATNFFFNGAPANGGGGTTTPLTISVTGGSALEGNPGAASSAGFLSTSGNQIVDANGRVVKLAGVNWFGLESETFAPHGLWARGYKDMMNQMKDLGFNLIRLPFSSQALQSNSFANGIDFAKNPDLQGLTGLQVMDKVVSYAGQIGLRIMLDHHRSAAGAGADGGLWYDATYTDAKWVSDWAMLAKRYANNPTVIGADLHNEPHGAATWGTGNVATDWRLAAERAGNAILAENPNWLIVVEGTDNGPSGSYWWGGNLSKAGEFPVRLNVANRLVYSPHDYPASVFGQQWFNDPNYPNNLDEVWDANWGYLFRTGTAPILLGEFGSKLETQSDQIWFDRITKYLAGDLNLDGTNDLAAGQQGMSWTFWSWNPNSGDTGGILNDDWTTVRADKMAKLTPIQFGVLDNGGSTAPNRVGFTVSLSRASTTPVTVTYSTANGTANAGSDYTSASGTITFAPGETSKTVFVTLTPDTTPEANETFTLTLSAASGGTIGSGTAAGTITNDDGTSPPPPPPPPSVSVGNVSMNEGNGAGTATFTVSLSSASANPVTVSYATSNGTATADSDYTAKTGTLTFAAGETSKTVTVNILGDTVVEQNETFDLLLSAPTNATIGTGTGTATLLNDDLPPPPPPPPPPASGGTTGSSAVTPVVRSSWSAGFIMDVTLKNTTGTAWKDWTVTFESDFTITNIWGAEIVSRVGNKYTVKAASWNRTVAANGGTVTFGFQAALPPGGSNKMRNIALFPVE